MKHKIKTNPFYQPEKQWQISIYIKRDYIALLDEAFDDIALANSSFEIDEDKSDWKVDIITDFLPNKSDIDSRLALFAGMAGIDTPIYDAKILEQKDWISEVESSFPPLTVGKFFVYGSHIKTPPPVNKIPLQVNAGAAFGSGEHATTSGCLLAITKLAKSRKFKNPLDMGCGSGILAIAAAKIWHCPVIGIDIDPVSVKVSRENALKNKAHKLVKFGDGDGYNTNLCRKNAKYDLIVANILARPLMKMAIDLNKHLAKGGVAILSGLLASQEKMVLSAHQVQGLKLIERISINGWNTLIIGR